MGYIISPLVHSNLARPVRVDKSRAIAFGKNPEKLIEVEPSSAGFLK